MGSAPAVPAAYALPTLHLILIIFLSFCRQPPTIWDGGKNPPLSAALRFVLICFAERSGADKGFPYQPGMEPNLTYLT
jgi:hypothetical protein